jgi:RND family efflux transporter MFP subunit
MKSILKLTFFSLLLVSCGNKEQSIDDILASKDIKSIQAKKDEMVSKQQELAAQIKRLDDSLKILMPDGNIPLVTAFNTKAEEFVHYVEIQGSVDTKQNILIAAEMSGVLEHVYVKEGDRVKKGQLLAKIDDGGLSQQKAQLKIQANLAKTTYERQKRLWEKNIGSEIQYLNAKSSYESLVESVNQIDKQISKTVVRAPFSGIIDDVMIEQGNVVSAGMSSIMRIVNLEDMYIRADVPESYITSITEGKKVEVYFPVLGKQIESSVRQTGSFINPANRTFSIEVAVPNDDNSIKPNLTSRLKINDYTQDKALLIPQSIISENADGEQYVYVLTAQKGNKAIAKQTIITTGKTQGDNIEILEGLKPGMQLIFEGARSVKDGQEVRIDDSL